MEPHAQAVFHEASKPVGLWRGLGAELGLCRVPTEPVLNLQVFSQRYSQEVQRRLGCKAAPASLQQAFLAARKALPALEAVALAGAVARSLVSPAEEAKIAQKMGPGGTRAGRQATHFVNEGCARAGQAPPSRVWVVGGNSSDAYSRFGEVGLGLRFLEGSNRSLGHFVVGHELSHNRHRDDLSDLGFKALAAGLGHNTVAKRHFENDRKAVYHAIELRCDQEGMEYALAQGVEKEPLLAQIAELLGCDPDTSTHPSGRRRLQLLRKSL